MPSIDLLMMASSDADLNNCSRSPPRIIFAHQGRTDRRCDNADEIVNVIGLA